MGRVWSFVLALVLAVVALATVPTPVEASPETERAADELLWLINDARAHHGLPGMQMRDDVKWIAGGHSGEMASVDAIYHNRDYFTEANRSRLRAGLIAENVGRGPTTQEIHDALMESDTHRIHILDRRLTVVGIGVTWDGDRWYITQDFVEPR